MSILQPVLDLLMAHGIIALIAMAVIALELAYMALGPGRAKPFPSFVANGMAGFSILVALYVSMVDGPPALIVIALLAALAAHWRDVFVRRRLTDQHRS